MSKRARDLFAGAGGWEVIPVRKWGWEVDGYEIMPSAIATRKEAGLVTRGGNVREVNGADGGYDIDIASPPCQTFGISGKGSGRRDLDLILQAVHLYRLEKNQEAVKLLAQSRDVRTSLVLEPLRVALEGRTPCLAWEQVPPVLPIWEACAEVLRDQGYSVVTGVLSAEQYGVAQTRRRAILVARRDGAAAALPVPTHSRFHSRTPHRLDEGVKPWISMATALGWGMTERPAFTVAGGGVDTGGAEPFANSSRSAMRKALEHGNWSQRSNYSAPQTRTAKTAEERGRGRREAAQPSFAITSKGFQFLEEGTSAMLRPTVQEVAILQSFPPDFPFQGVKGKQFLQVGNAVPPLLGSAILAQFRD